uniref:F-box family protein n=1 Tax=Silene vulgaris TaxID=42043 RepID=T1RU12_SILVU|nr:f-box family protein [Silene vulgaris]
MKLRPRKRLCLSKEDRDRLSELPDTVIVRILSYMPIIDAVRTVLLRRFGNLWTLVDTLKFDEDTYDYKDHDCNEIKRVDWYCCFVRNVLMLHQNPSIHTFHLCIEFDEVMIRSKDDLRGWLRFPLDRQAKNIKLSDTSYHAATYHCNSIFPNLESQFLVTLNLDSCKLDGELQVNLGSLNKLSLCRVGISVENFQRFISGCPSLQELVLVNPYWTTNISFSAPNIAKFSLFLTYDYQGGFAISLNCPNLTSLYLDLDLGELNIVDVSSVRDIYIKHFFENMHLSDDGELLAIIQMFGKLESIEVFQLSNDASKPFLQTIQDVQLLRHGWKHIVLDLRELSDSCLLGIYHLMRSLKHLEELTIYTTEDFRADTDLLRLELPSPYVTPQLKTISLHGYGKSWRSQLQLIEFLLKSAPALDKLVIVPIQCRLKEAEELEFVKNVSNFPRASPSARVTFV